jgi:predicted small lipoprotein YifL
MVFRIDCMKLNVQTSVAGAFRRPSIRRATALLLALPMLATGCGQTGPLTLPKPAAPAASAAGK